MQYSINSTNSELEVEFIQAKLYRAKNYLEYGSGASTMMASKFKGLKTISIETDPDYILYLRDELPSNYLERTKSEIIHIDIGPVGEWGWPIEPQSSQKFNSYNFAVWRYLREIQFKPDLILLDGRFRVSTLVSSIINSPNTLILFDDYFDRAHYKIVENLIQPHKEVGRIGVFKSPRFLTHKQIKTAYSILGEYILDPS